VGCLTKGGQPRFGNWKGGADVGKRQQGGDHAESREEETALLRELDGIIASDRYFLSPRITTLQAIRTKRCPEPAREPLPPMKHSEPRASAREGGDHVEGSAGRWCGPKN